MTLEQGAILHGRYRIVEILGQGGMGSVYRAIDENLGVEVAVKENLFTTDEYARQFRLEAVILASLRQPNLPRVTDHFVVNNQGQYLVMDYIEGEDLRQRMERLGSIPEEEAILIGASICDALAYLHSRKPPVLHRDIKPGNVKITPEGHVYLVDFGLAKVMRGSQATTTGARAMTPGYSPPEQYGTARTDAHSDIYSLGATLYAALTGVIPEDGLARVMDNVQLTPLRKRNPKVSRKLAAAIEKAMEPYPDDRFQSDEDFKRALLAASANTQKPESAFIVAAAPVEADRPPSKPLSAIEQQAEKVGMRENTPARLKKKKRKRSLGWVAFSLLLVLVIVVLTGLVINYPTLIPPEAAGILPQGWLPSITPTATQTAQPSPTLEPTAEGSLSLDSQTMTPTKRVTLTSTSTSSPTITFTPSITPTLIGGGLGTIAFASNRSGIPQIYLMNSDGTDQRAITTESDGACQPDWSPDGIKIVYISPCRLKESDYPGANLYIVNADGTGREPLGGSIEGDFDPVWSPDGKSIAFTSLRDGHAQIYKLDLETKEVVRLTETEVNIQTRQPDWSPDGTQIAYTLRRVGVFQIWVMTSAGKAHQQLIRSGTQYSDFLPSWSPDGAFLSYSQTESFVQSPSPAWLMAMRYEDRDKSSASVKVNAVTPIVDVDYSPDGYWLIFESVSADPSGSNQDIYLMTISGGDRTRLTRDPDADFDPAWKPVPPQPATATSTP